MTTSETVQRVIVLGTGRCGTVTFIRGCEHFDGWTAGHESRARLIGSERFAYPLRHIEADNRLCWMLGALARTLDDATTLYVHLTRDPEAVAASFERRWNSTYRASIIRAFGHGIITEIDEYGPDRLRELCQFYVHVVNDNIANFLVGRRSMPLQLETLSDQFVGFMDAIGADGDRAAIIESLATIHNAS